MNAKRWLLVAAFVLTCAASATAGFWAGFREGWWLSAAASALPRGSAALTHLRSLAAGKPNVVAQALESDVDNALVHGYDLFEHPLAGWLGRWWNIPVGPYQKSAARLAAYRKNHASPLATEQAGAMFAPGVGEGDKGFADLLEEGRRYAVFKIDAMVKRYAP